MTNESLLAQIPDKVLQQALTQTVKGNLTHKKLEKLTKLIWNDDTGATDVINDFTGLRLCPNLKEMHISGQAGFKHGKLNNLEELQYLPKLTKLSLTSYRGLSLKLLAPLSQLTYLDLNGTNSIRNITPLASLVNLQHLNLRGADTQKLDTLSKLTQLCYLNIAFNGKVKSLAPLQGLTKITELHLNFSYVDDLTPLTYLKNVKKLSIPSYYGYDDLTKLAALKKISSLEVDSFEGLDLAQRLPKLKTLEIFCRHLNEHEAQLQEALGKLQGLEKLHAIELGDKDDDSLPPFSLNFVTQLSNLRHLSLDRGNPTDFRALATLPHLESLHLEHITLQSSGFIRKLTQLKELTVNDAYLNHLEDFKGLTQLESLSVSALYEKNESITDLSPLAGMSQLKCLNLKTLQNVSDLSPIGKLHQLTSLDIVHLNFTDIAPLLSLGLKRLCISSPHLTSIDFVQYFANLEDFTLYYDHNVQDISPLLKLRKLKQVEIRNVHTMSFEQDSPNRQVLEQLNKRGAGTILFY